MRSVTARSNKNVITVLSTNERNRIHREKKAEGDIAFAMEEESKKDGIRARCKKQMKQDVKNGKVKAYVRVREGQQEIEMESGEDVDSGDDDNQMVERIAAAMVASIPEIPKQTKVSMIDGRMINIIDANFKIIDFLKKVKEYQDIGPEFLAKCTGIDLTNSINDDYRRALVHNPGIVWKDTIDGSFTIRRKASLGVENETCLRHLFKVSLPAGHVKCEDSDLNALCIHEKQLQNTYAGVERDIDMMRAEGDVDYLVDESSRERWRIFYRVQPGIQAAPSIRELWNSTTLPPQSDMREVLIARNLRTRDEFDARDERARKSCLDDLEEIKAAKAEKKEQKKRRRIGCTTGAASFSIQDVTGMQHDD
jgi:hypothetical protein